MPSKLSASQPSSLVDFSAHDGVVVLTLNRPPINALSRAVLDELRAALEQCAVDSQTRAVVITSALSNVFSAGADLQEFKELTRQDLQGFVACGQELFSYMESTPKPIIAAVRGVAMGGGCELALACDLRVAGQSARFAQPEVNLGLIPGWGGTQRLPRLIGKTVGLEMVLTGESISADRALAVGLVNKVVPNNQVLDEAQRVAQTLAFKSPLALAMIKKAVHLGMDLSLRGGVEMEATFFLEAAATRDAQDGIQTFLEKRRPNGRGHQQVDEQREHTEGHLPKADAGV